MPASNQDIKDFFALSGNNPNVTNTQLTKIVNWMKVVTPWVDGDPDPDANTLVDLLYKDLTGKVKNWLKDEQTVTF